MDSHPLAQLEYDRLLADQRVVTPEEKREDEKRQKQRYHNTRIKRAVRRNAQA